MRGFHLIVIAALSTRQPGWWSRWCRLVLVLILGVGCRSEQNYSMPLLRAETSELRHTSFAPTLRTRLDPTRNLLYCATFQLAWKHLMALSGGPIVLKKQPPSSSVDELNRAEIGAKDVDPASSTIQVRANKAAGRISIEVELKKNLLFPVPFRRLKHGTIFRSGPDAGRPVWAFGFDLENKKTRRRQIRQVEVIDYRGPEDFVLRLRTRSASDRLVLARMKPSPTLLDTYHLVEARIARAKGHVETPRLDDQLIVPLFNFELRHQFAGLVGGTLASGRMKNWFIDAAKQLIRLRLDEKGARLYSSAKLTVSCSRGPRPTRVFDLSAPFLLYMRRTEGTSPYFLMWVGHPEILVGNSQKR